MALYYATCPAGLETLAARFAATACKGFRLERTMPGGVLFHAKERMQPLPYFQNCYAVLAQYAKVSDMRRATDRALEDKAMLAQADRLMVSLGFATFRVMFSDKNTLVAVEPAKRAALERGIRGARVDRERPDTELLILARREGFAMALLRLAMPHGWRAAEVKGVLSQPMAACMVALGRFGAGGVFLDPFAGSGALGKARLALGNAQKVILSDVDGQKVEQLRRALRGQGPDKLILRQADALGLAKGWQDGPVQELVCDPPWGLYEPLPQPAERFYADMLAEFEAIMAPQGRLVVLTADKECFEGALESSAFAPKERHDVLVHGKKAAIFLGTKG